MSDIVSIIDRPPPPGRKTKPLRGDKRYGKSAVTNHRDLLPNVDARSAIARRFRDICGSILQDQGGADLCSESRVQLIRRFAAASVLAEQMESELANDDATIDIAQHALLCSSLVRLSNKIGIDRRAKPIKSLDEHIAEKKARALQPPIDVKAREITP